MPTGSYPGCCLVLTGVSSGGTSSPLSGSVNFGSGDGSNIRCAFHGAATCSVVVGTTCAFAGDTRLRTTAAAGAGALLRPRPRSAIAKQDRFWCSPFASSREKENTHFITHYASLVRRDRRRHRGVDARSLLKKP